ncbi:MAG: DUF11 domain-containing protein [Aquificota bacterium]|nr:MAG: DUF11 domain-containing protein [Aquificota bacterium]
MKIKQFYLFFVVALLFSFNQGFAREKLDIKMKGFLITFEKKGEKFVVKRNPLPEQVKPDDIIEYQITVKNPTKRTFKEVFIKAPMPEGTTFVKNSETKGAVFSIDKGKTYHRPPIKYIVIENGKKIEKIATPEMYTNIGWMLEKVKPGEKKTFFYWVKVKK